MDEKSNKLHVQDVCVGKLRRVYTIMRVNICDDVMYAGTMSGDIVKIKLNCPNDPEAGATDIPPIMLGCYGRHNPKKPAGKDCERYLNGVRDLLILDDSHLIVGAGDGTVELVQERNVKFDKNYPMLPTWPKLKMVGFLCFYMCALSLFLTVKQIVVF